MACFDFDRKILSRPTGHYLFKTGHFFSNLGTYKTSSLKVYSSHYSSLDILYSSLILLYSLLIFLFFREMLLLLVLVSATAFAKPSLDQQWTEFKERSETMDNDHNENDDID